MARIFPAVPKYFDEVSEGVRVGGGLTFHAAPYLPVLYFNTYERLDVVLHAGTIVALDQWGYLVPANGGIGTNTLTYSSLDVTEGVYDLDSFTNVKTNPTVAAPKTTTTALTANAPVGVLEYDMFRWDMDADPLYKVQREIGLLNDWLILVPVTSAMQSAYGVSATVSLGKYYPGAVVAAAYPGIFVPFIATTADITATGAAYSITNMDQAVGRILKIENVATDSNFTGGYENVANVPGLGLSGKENGGLPHGIDPTTKLGMFIQIEL